MSRIFFIVAIGLMLAACKRPETVSYESLLNDLVNPEAIARLDVPSVKMISSHDRRGANEDYNHFQGKTDDGQMILADLKGPGIVNRFWFTGIEHDRKIRFYFDGEKTPRFEFSWNDLIAGYPPFNTPPLSVHGQYCWHTYLPVPFRKQLLITTDDAGYRYGQSPKMYYQLNWSPLAKGKTVDSLSLPVDAAKIEAVAEKWEGFDFGELPKAEKEFTIESRQAVELWNGHGPAAVEAFTIDSGIYDPDVLRNVRLLIYWDDAGTPSVNVPLGDFFGSVWQRWRAESMFFGSRGNTFFSHFPMPFKTAARIVLENKSAQPLNLKFGIKTGEHFAGGYFHAAWRNSGANETGKPHIVLEANGKGRYAGCILSCVSADRSFWMLESDESMYMNGTKTWQGTGLEDYFNSGWYYQSIHFRPLHGLPLKSPFRTVQYRLHLPDAVTFDGRFRMEFERGPDHASHAAFESVAFYYLDTPQPANSKTDNLKAPVDTLQPYTLMTDLWNYERFNDLQGEIEYIDLYSQQRKPAFQDVLDLRRLNIQYEQQKISKKEFFNALNLSTNEYAEILKRLHSELDAALVQFYCNMPSELYLRGELILRAGDPQRPSALIVSLPKGKHVFAIRSVWQSYPDWVQLAVRTADGFLLGTSEHWKHAINPSGDWMTLEYDDSSWSFVGPFEGYVKSPPEEPYIMVQPDPFINMLSKAYGLRPSAPWPTKKGHVVYRYVFEVK